MTVSSRSFITDFPLVKMDFGGIVYYEHGGRLMFSSSEYFTKEKLSPANVTLSSTTEVMDSKELLRIGDKILPKLTVSQSTSLSVYERDRLKVVLGGAFRYLETVSLTSTRAFLDLFLYFELLDSYGTTIWAPLDIINPMIFDFESELLFHPFSHSTRLDLVSSDTDDGNTFTVVKPKAQSTKPEHLIKVLDIVRTVSNRDTTRREVYSIYENVNLDSQSNSDITIQLSPDIVATSLYKFDK